MQYNYTEIVKDGAHNRGNVLLIPNNMNNIDLDYYGKESVDSFNSVFLHSKDFLLYREIHGGVKGYDGNVFSRSLFWDMDNVDITRARQDTIELVERLFKYNHNNVKIYFSGNKGFHVLYLCPELKTYIGEDTFNDIVRNTCKNIASELSSFDERIYDKTRIFRTLNSKHSKTNLYKIEVSYDELNSLSNEELYELASKQRKSDKIIYDDSFNDEIVELLNNSKTFNTVKRGLYDASELLDGIEHGFSRGGRNSGYASVAGMLHARNMDDRFIEAVLQGINSGTQDPLPKEEISSIVSSISRYPVNPDYIEAKDEDIIGIEEAGEEWYKIITNSGYTSFGDRFSHLNERLKLCIPGDTIAFIATSGTGKTTMGLELGNEEAKARDMYSLIASLEMSRAGIFFRAATIEAVDLSIGNYVPSTDVASTLLRDNVLRDKVYTSWKNLKIIDKGGLSLDKVVEYYKSAASKYKMSNLVIDYAQNLKDSEKIDYAMMMARRFKEIAKELQTKLFILMQCNKTVTDDYTEIQKNHVEGSGAYIQAMDYIISAWKSRDQKNRLHCKLMKDRWGDSEYKFDLVRDGLKYHTEDYLPDRMTGGL